MKAVQINRNKTNLHSPPYISHDDVMLGSSSTVVQDRGQNTPQDTPCSLPRPGGSVVDVSDS